MAAICVVEAGERACSWNLGCWANSGGVASGERDSGNGSRGMRMRDDCLDGAVATTAGAAIAESYDCNQKTVLRNTGRSRTIKYFAQAYNDYLAI